MRYTVLFRNASQDEFGPEQELAAIWNQERESHNPIAESVRLLDQQLSLNPYRGKHLSEGLWQIDSLPLVWMYSIQEDDKTVFVEQIKYLR